MRPGLGTDLRDQLDVLETGKNRVHFTAPSISQGQISALTYPPAAGSPQHTRPRLSFASKLQDLGEHVVGSEGSVRIDLLNDGGGAVEIRLVEPSPGLVLQPGASERLEPGQRGQLELRFAVPSEPGVIQHDLVVESSDADRPRQIVRLQGRAVAAAEE